MFWTIAAGALIAKKSLPTTELTIYNQGFAFVKQDRTLDLKLGRQTVSIQDVAAQIEPSSVGIKSLTDENSFNVLEQNYQYDLISRTAILNKSVGQKITFIRTIGNTRDVLTGVLLNPPTSIVNAPEGGAQQSYNGMVIRTDDGKIVLDPVGEVEVDQVPPGLISRPTLLWDLDATRAGANNIELSYITQGINWNADYVMTLDGQGMADLQGWVTIDNKSGTNYDGAQLKLLAGDVHQVMQPRAMFGGIGGAAVREMAKAPFQEQSLFEYHLYTLQRPATVHDRETKQISLLTGKQIPVKKKLIIDAMRGYNDYYPNEGEVGTGDIRPQVRIEFTNDEASHLGMPLPKGRIRLYQRDKDGSSQFIGEDEIDHTPRNENLSLVVGRSFDIVATRKRTNFTQLSPNTVRESFQVEVRNRKESSETVYVLERHWGDWKIQEHSAEFTKQDANTIQFVLNLKPNEVQTVSYTVQTRY